MRQRRIFLLLLAANAVSGIILIAIVTALYWNTGHGCVQYRTVYDLLEGHYSSSADAGAIHLDDVHANFFTKPTSTEFVHSTGRSHAVYRYKCGRSMIELWFSGPRFRGQPSKKFVLYAARVISHDHNGVLESKWWTFNAKYFADYAKVLGAKLIQEE